MALLHIALLKKLLTLCACTLPTSVVALDPCKLVEVGGTSSEAMSGKFILTLGVKYG